MDKNRYYTELLDLQLSQCTDENRFLEFKSNYQDVDKLGKYISALSNGACLENKDYGYLYFGIEDNTHEIKGTTFDYVQQKAAGNQNNYVLVVVSNLQNTPKLSYIENPSQVISLTPKENNSVQINYYSDILNW